VSEAEFWSCVRNGANPGRGMPEVPVGALPADLVHVLVTRVGLADAEIAAMNKEQALARLQRYWTEGA